MSIQRARIEAATVEGQQDINAYLVRAEVQWGQARVLGSIEEKVSSGKSENAQSFADRLLIGPPLMLPFSLQPWGARELSIVDPDGHVLVLSSDTSDGQPAGALNGASPALSSLWGTPKAQPGEWLALKDDDSLRHLDPFSS